MSREYGQLLLRPGGLTVARSPAHGAKLTTSDDADDEDDDGDGD